MGFLRLTKKTDLIFIFIGFVMIALLLYGFKTSAFEHFDASSDAMAQYNPILLNLFYLGFSQFHSDDSNTYNINLTFAVLKKDIYISPSNLLIACDFTENINKSDILNCDQIHMERISTSYAQNNAAVSLTNANGIQQNVTIFNQDYFFACKTINFTDCVLDTTVLPVQNLIPITMEKIYTYNGFAVQTQYKLTFTNTNMSKFVFCRPMIIYIQPWGLFRVVHQSKALQNGTSVPNNCMCFYNTQSNLNTILVEFIQPKIHNFKTQNTDDNFTISPVPTAAIKSPPDPINELKDVTLFYLNFNYLTSPPQSNTITTCGSFLIHLCSKNKNFTNISSSNQTIVFKLSNVVDNTVLSYINLYLHANDNPTLCINSQCVSGNNTGNYFPSQSEFDMTRKFDKYDVFLSFSKNQITLAVFTLAGTVNNHLLKRVETNFAVQSTCDVMDAEYERLAGQGYILSPLIGSSLNTYMSRYCIPNFEQLGTDLGYLV